MNKSTVVRKDEERGIGKLQESKQKRTLARTDGDGLKDGLVGGWIEGRD